MRKSILALVIVMIVAVIATVAMAAAIYDRSTATLGKATGTVQWTNTWKYSAVELKRIWVSTDLSALDTVTVTRVSSDGVYTQAVGTVTVAANAGNTASFTAAYLKNGDWLNFSGAAVTGATVMIEYEVQQP